MPPVGPCCHPGSALFKEKREGGPEGGYVGSQAKLPWASLRLEPNSVSPSLLMYPLETRESTRLFPLTAPLLHPGTLSVSPPKTSSASSSPSPLSRLSKAVISDFSDRQPPSPHFRSCHFSSFLHQGSRMTWCRLKLDALTSLCCSLDQGPAPWRGLLGPGQSYSFPVAPETSYHKLV